MRKLTTLLVVVAACGSDHQPASRPVPEGEPVAPVATPAPRNHPAPTCPLANAAWSGADPDAPVEGLEGESRNAIPPSGDRCEPADSNLTRVETAILAAKRTGSITSKPWDHKRAPER